MFSQFNEDQAVIILESTEVLDIGGVTVTDNSYLSNSRLQIFKQSTSGDTAVLQMKAYSDSGLTTQIGSTNTFNVADISSDTNWIGWIPFEWVKPVGLGTSEVFFSVQATGYTRGGTNDFLSICFDVPDKLYGGNNATSANVIYHEFYVLKGRD